MGKISAQPNTCNHKMFKKLQRLLLVLLVQFVAPIVIIVYMYITLTLVKKTTTFIANSQCQLAVYHLLSDTHFLPSHRLDYMITWRCLPCDILLSDMNVAVNLSIVLTYKYSVITYTYLVKWCQSNPGQVLLHMTKTNCNLLLFFFFRRCMASCLPSRAKEEIQSCVVCWRAKSTTTALDYKI